MVLGARELKCAAGEFLADSLLEITVTLLMQDERFGSFECVISANDEPLSSGRVNTFQPTQQELTTLFQQGASS
jgi:Predicted 3-hydroxylacyl-(acyl carrier protein) dehydratase